MSEWADSIGPAFGEEKRSSAVSGSSEWAVPRQYQDLQRLITCN